MKCSNMNLAITKIKSVGLIDTDWGGTPVEAWSSPDALAKCGVKMEQSDEQTEYIIA